jgi:hypothetical protein
MLFVGRRGATIFHSKSQPAAWRVVKGKEEQERDSIDNCKQQARLAAADAHESFSLFVWQSLEGLDPALFNALSFHRFQ